MRRCEARGNVVEIADLLRIQAEIAMAQPSPDLEVAERNLLSAIDWSRRQSALWWELRAATVLGRLWSENGRPADAYRLVKGVYDQFTEGFDTTDLLQARQLLDRLGASEG
jgi:predicted ATPase